MDIEKKLWHVEPDAPNRCQANHKAGQCRYGAVENSQYCAMHGGNKAQEPLRAKALRAYQLAKWQSSVDSFANDDEVKSLRAEIGILRMLIEQIFVKCRDAGSLLLYTGQISDLVTKVEKLVVSCHRLESNLGLVLDKSKILEIAVQIVSIIGEEIEDEDVLSRISDKIVRQLVLVQGNTDAKSGL